MQLSHSRRVVSAVFDEPNLVSAAGLVPIMKLASQVGLRSVADRFLTVPTDKGANPGLKVSSLVAGMLAGADSIDDMAILRHGGMGRVFDAAYAPSTLGSFLRSFTFGHVRQLDAVACRVLAGLRTATPLLNGVDGDVLVDVVDLRTYEKGIKISDRQIRELEASQLHRHEFHGDWHYSMHPATRPNTPT